MRETLLLYNQCMQTSLRTARLILRRWKQPDIKPFAAMNSDPEVMEFFPSVLSLEQSVDMVKSIEDRFDKEGYGLWAVEIEDTGEFVGFVGLSQPKFDTHFTPCVEVGWRIARRHWGKGYAPEAAKEALRDGFERLDLSEIVSFTAALNNKSIRVMEKIGMRRNAEDDFLHPLVEDGSPLKPHVLYRLSRDQWLSRAVEL